MTPEPLSNQERAEEELEALRKQMKNCVFCRNCREQMDTIGKQMKRQEN